MSRQASCLKGRTELTLASACRTKIPENVVWKYATQLTLALKQCHSESDSEGQQKAIILHRDLKPDNGQSPLLPLLDPFRSSDP